MSPQSSQGAPARGRPRSLESEQAILDATMELLSELGYRGVTVDAIAARAGASKSTIYRRWPTKENLVIAAFGQTPLLTPPPRGDVIEQLVEVINQFARAMQDTPLGGVLPALVAERAQNPSLDEALGPLVRQRRQTAVDILKQAVARGELPRGINHELAVDLLTGPVLQRIMVMGQKTDRRFVRQVVETVCNPGRGQRVGRGFMRTLSG
ncbi:MAG: TetR/AcrR family transcriptional regulator [Gammaproteobacteria bacterium]|nr:TetR/AcrR family transcriptional regulator [Gammaproteobacteria bacterium]